MASWAFAVASSACAWASSASDWATSVLVTSPTSKRTRLSSTWRVRTATLSWLMRMACWSRRTLT
jgi:hypothetical protein